LEASMAAAPASTMVSTISLGHIDIFMGWDNHVFLVKQFEDPIAHYINPKNGNDSSKELKEILKLMSWSKDGFFGLIKKI